MSQASDIAIIGMFGRFPRAENIDALWDLLINGREAAGSLTDSELLARAVSQSDLDDPSYVKRGSILAGYADFDAEFFGYSAGQASTIDPQQRLFLEAAWSALEAAGYDPDQYCGDIGVFAGSGESHYLQSSVALAKNSLDIYKATLDGDKDFLTTRVSYKLNLTGPSIGIQTACSSSLVAVHYASQSLLAFESDLVLAGGVSIRLPQGIGYKYFENGIASPDGRCRAFAADANGTFPGSGVGVVVLKRLADALADGDYIHAVLKGSAVNNDGARKAGFTAPSVTGQSAAITTALMLAGVGHNEVGMIEAHGTGTILGDAIEITALNEIFGSARAGTEKCALGSIKSNIGHLEAASGIVGLIKAVLCVEKGLLVPSLHCSIPNEALNGKTFFVPSVAREWKGNDGNRYAGISSFGIGGTNAHVVIGNYRHSESRRQKSRAQLFPLSAHCEKSLREAKLRLAKHLEKNPSLSTTDVATTLQKGRKQFPFRQYFITSDLDELRGELLRAAGMYQAKLVPSQRGGVAFMFPGQGSEIPGIATGLYAAESAFARHLDQCASLFTRHLGIDVRSHLCCEDRIWSGDQRSLYVQPVLFSFQYSLAKLWLEWGVVPKALVGHSSGEFAAACIAGIISLDDAASIVSTRAKLLSNLPPGRMIAVGLSEEECKPLCNTGIAIAAVNAPFRCVLSGPVSQMSQLESKLRETRINFARLPVVHAFHSPAVEEAVPLLRNALSAVRFSPAKYPFSSSTFGGFLSNTSSISGQYWEHHMTGTTQFSRALLAIQATGSCTAFLEVGSGQSLSVLARQNGLARNGAVIAASLPDASSADRKDLLGVLGKLWTSTDLSFSPTVTGTEGGRRIPLPTYSFQRKRYWLKQSPNDLPPRVPVPPEVCEPDLPVSFHDPEHVAPTNELEIALIGILEETLGTSGIGIEDSFLNLGGDSLMGLTVVRRIRDELGLELPLAELVGKNVTVAMLRDSVLMTLERRLGAISNISGQS